MDHLSGALARCETDFAAMSRPGQGEPVRGYGNDRAIRVQAAIRKYEDAFREFFGAWGSRSPPRRQTPPLAG